MVDKWGTNIVGSAYTSYANGVRRPDATPTLSHGAHVKRRMLVLLGLCLLLHPAAARAQDDAYVDAEARELVRLARLRRDDVDRRIETYRTLARERFSVALRAGIAEKLVYRRETATRIDWERDGPVRMNVLGMREVAPMFVTKPEVPADISAELLRLSFDPVGTDMFLRMDTVALRHPLADGGEAHYRYEAGGTTTLTLPDGRAIRLRELRVIPRRAQLTLLSGSLWLEEQTHAVVQIYMRLASNFDADRNGGSFTVAQAEESEGDSTRTRSITLNSLPGFVRPVRADIDFIAIEYGLYDLQWWMPRRLAAQGHVQVSGMRIPLSYERTYDDYAIVGDTSSALITNVPVRPGCIETVRFEISPDDPARDSARAAVTGSERARRARMAAQSREDGAEPTPDCTREFILSAPSDSALLHSAELPESPFDDDMTLIADGELEDMIERVRRLPDALRQVGASRFQWGLNGPGLIRYNRVEGLSLGARLLTQLGRYQLSAEARLGHADLEPRGGLAVERAGDAFNLRTAAYRRLMPTHPNTSVPGMWESLGALVLARDDDHYFDAVGADLHIRPADALPQWYDVRLYAERQRAVERETHFSIAHLLNSNTVFDENFTADAADQVGARVRLRSSLGRNPGAPRLAGELSLGAETGDFRILRPEALLRFTTPLVARTTFGLEGAVGTVEGNAVPAQALFRLGGASTLRGYGSSTLVGERYWRTRAELGYGIPAARITLFSDAGWAADRTRFDVDGAVYSLGIGGSFADGLVRLDLARAMKAPTGWRLHLHFNGF